MDIVLNQSYGLSPMVQLYWDAANNRPAANNPWYNPVQPHAFGFGYDFNHESPDTKYFVNRVTEHWLTQYKIDGFRFDFSKGFTQKPSTNDAQFSAYDQSRIDILKAIYNNIKAIVPDAYMILEHLTANDEEKELANNGMLLWGNMNYNYNEASMGWPGNWDFSNGIYTTRTWTVPHLVTYMESHDEERIVFKNINYGNSSGNYTVRDTTTALKRMELNAAFLFTIPGPKMFWQFGELGYPYSINTCENGTIDNNCRLSPKPIRWDYWNDARRKTVYNTYSRLIQLRFHPLYKDAFVSGAISQSLNGAVKWIQVSSGDSSQLLVVGNFDVVPQTGVLTFPKAGTWYNYLDSTTLSATGSAQNISLQPGEFRVYLNRSLKPGVTPPADTSFNGSSLEVKAYPNPVPATFILEVGMPADATLTLNLYNSVGQWVTTINKGFLTKGKHKLSVNKPLVQGGIYYLKLSTQTEVRTIPVIIQ
jgi:1,4-alpha-glucan branching enzyme